MSGADGLPDLAGTVQCIDCVRFSLKDAGEMGKLGFGLCAMTKNNYEYRSSVYPRQCKHWKLPEPEDLAVRQEWQQKQKRKEG